jgi:hypothetical protein
VSRTPYERSVPVSSVVAAKESRYADVRSSDYRSSASATAVRVDDRNGSSKSRYIDSGYAERSNPSHPWSAPSQPSFGTLSSAIGIPDNRGGWAVDSAGDRYDRTYNERKMQSQSASFGGPGYMPSSGRPGDRYGNPVANRSFENRGRF